jgi:hypothetical protein
MFLVFKILINVKKEIFQFDSTNQKTEFWHLFSDWLKISNKKTGIII